MTLGEVAKISSLAPKDLSVGFPILSFLHEIADYVRNVSGVSDMELVVKRNNEKKKKNPPLNGTVKNVVFLKRISCNFQN